MTSSLGAVDLERRASLDCSRYGRPSVAVSTTDGCISIPESAQYYGDAVRQLAHEKRPLNKLGYRKMKRTLRRLEKQQPSASSERRAN